MKKIVLMLIVLLATASSGLAGYSFNYDGDVLTTVAQVKLTDGSGGGPYKLTVVSGALIPIVCTWYLAEQTVKNWAATLS